MSGELTTFTGFCSLGNFNLKLIGIYQVFGCNTKTAACNLFNSTSYTVAVFKRFETYRIFTTFTGIASSADPVHCNSKCFMSFTTD